MLVCFKFQSDSRQHHSRIVSLKEVFPEVTSDLMRVSGVNVWLCSSLPLKLQLKLKLAGLPTMES